MKGEITINSDNVVKSGEPRLMRVEVEKTRRGRLIGRESGLFLVPRVLEFDPVRGVAVFEKIDGLIPYREAFVFGETYREASRRLGEALAVIHRDLILPEDMVEPLPLPLAMTGREVFLHGDFSVYNICQDEEGRLVIIDWQMTGVHEGRATRGTPCFDLIWFINNLFYRPTFRHFRSREPILVARSFLEGYYHLSPDAPPVDLLADYADRFFSFKKPRRRVNASRRERPLLFLSHRLARIFINELRLGRLTA
jgi:Phosphotransferase enzyme family